MCIWAIHHRDLFYGSGQRALGRRDRFLSKPRSVQLAKLFLESHLLHWLLIRPGSPVRLTRLTSVPLLVLASPKIGLKGPGVGFSCHSRKQELTACLLIILVSIHIWVNNHQKLKIWHKLRTRKMKRFTSILFSRAGENAQLVYEIPLSYWNIYNTL